VRVPARHSFWIRSFISPPPLFFHVTKKLSGFGRNISLAKKSLNDDHKDARTHARAHYANVAARIYKFTTDRMYPNLFIFICYLCGYRLGMMHLFLFRVSGNLIVAIVKKYVRQGCVILITDNLHLYLFPMPFYLKHSET